jgi:hypothetical protein
VVGFTVTTGARPVPGVIVVAPGEGGYVIVSMTATGGACSVDPTFGTGRCDLGDLPANAIVPVTVNYRTTVDGASGTARVNAFTPVDNNPLNNFVTIAYTTVAHTDLQLQLAQTTASTLSGERLTFPRITVSNLGTKDGRNAVVQIPLPAFTTVESISASGVYCSGTTTLSCQVWSFAPGQTYTIDIALTTTAAGTFTSNVTMQSGNDSTAGNNSGAVVLTVNPPQSIGGGSSSGGGGSGSSSGGGGGGRFEWLALVFLWLLAANRARRPRLHPST